MTCYDLDPKIHAIQGKNNQGIEWTNQTIKIVVAKTVDSMNAEYLRRKHSWLTVYICMSLIISSMCNHGSDISSPYEHTFGMPFDEPLHKKSLKSCHELTVAERAQLCGGCIQGPDGSEGAVADQEQQETQLKSELDKGITALS